MSNIEREEVQTVIQSNYICRGSIEKNTKQNMKEIITTVHMHYNKVETDVKESKEKPV